MNSDDLRPDLGQVRTEVVQLRSEVMGELRGLRGEMAGELGGLRSEMMGELRELRAEMRELRADMRSHFRWTVTTMVALFGVAVPIWMWFLNLILKLR